MKKSKTSKKPVEHYLLMYVEDCSPKIKKFSTSKKMGKFVETFQKKYPDHMAMDSGSWIDYCVMGVTGPIHFFTDGIKVK